MHTLTDDSVCIPFEYTDGVNTLRDSITMTRSDFDAREPGQLEAMQTQRFEAWLAAMSAPAVENSDSDEVI